MRAVLVFGLALVASASAFVSISKPYHEEIGIPQARRIKAYEESLMANKQAKTVSEFQADRIIGGVVASANAHPYLGGLIINLINIRSESVCGSSLISTNRLVTAAHCWFDGTHRAWQFVVVLGSQFLFLDGFRMPTSNVAMHPQYSPRTLFNDIAMIYLPNHVPLSHAIQPISLPDAWELSNDFVGSIAVAAGYGRTSDQQSGVGLDTVVRHVNLQVISMAECQRIYQSSIIASTLCTSGQGGVGVCSGDSGGPLVVNRWGRLTLIGVTSFAARVNGVQACQRGFPSGFARVTSFYNFITQHM
ncbi:hypothetical protein O3G_MSEX002350 [Manduca sexta]|uniref:Peptidase S1 domain-containing protein n=1 Tax=Manduca sexta TaxID=7130 RepID=A0A922CE16_MANSE|nr:hypothetical protein O3G_MSEX002350 [Manduca sexta]KAG6442444.1 hypothetical protein O3G_MSEX002350 [Manduca sexta]